MNEYLTTKETSEALSLSIDYIQHLCGSNKIDGAIKFGKYWCVPKKWIEAEKINRNIK